MAEPTCSAGMELGRAQGHPDIPLLRPVWRRNEEKDKQARSKHHPDTNSGTLCLVEKLTPKHYPCNTNVSAKSMDRRRSHQAAYRGVYIRERVAFRPSVRPSGRWSSCPVSWVCAVHLALPELPRKRVSVKARSADISPAQYCPWQAQEKSGGGIWAWMHPWDPTPLWLRRKRVPSVLPDGLVCGAAGGERASTQRGGGQSSGPWVCPRRSLCVVPQVGHVARSVSV